MINWASKWLAVIAGVAILVITVLISVDVLMRYFLDKPQLFVDELASFLQVFVIFGGLAYTFLVGGHVRGVSSGRARPVRPGRARANVKMTRRRVSGTADAAPDISRDTQM